MSNQEEKNKHRKRIQNRKAKERFRSPIAKELVTNPALRPRVVKDKRGREHDLDKMDFIDLVEAIKE